MEVTPSNINGAVAKELNFRWDASFCMGLKIERNQGTIVISNDGKEVPKDDLPSAWGTVYLTPHETGFYSVRLSYNGTCLNNTKIRRCGMTRSASINVAAP
jgi:hypothetical protein